MEALRELEANVIASADLNRYLEKGLAFMDALSEQKVFLFKVSAARLTALLENAETWNYGGRRVALTISMLCGDLDDQPRKATVILLNAEKEILPTEEMIKQLEDLDDPAQVLETPNLVVIPFD